MRDLRVHRVEPEVERRQHAFRPPDGARIVEGEARVIDEETGATVALQLVDPAEEWADDLARSFRRVRWDGQSKGNNEYRLSGIVSTHRTFGTVAPVPLRRRYGCSASRFDEEFPRLALRLERIAGRCWERFCEAAPAEAVGHFRTVEGIDRSWMLGDAPWTSGIINNTAALPYHRDAGNCARSWSAMLCARRGVSGGLLHLAEYDLWLAIPNGSLTLFDGQSILHGVTPFSVDGEGAYRYTVVFYAKAAVRSCLCGQAEVERAQRLRTEAEERSIGARP